MSRAPQIMAALMLAASAASPAGVPSFAHAPKNPHQGRSRGRFGHTAPLSERIGGKKRKAKGGKGGRR